MYLCGNYRKSSTVNIVFTNECAHLEQVGDKGMSGKYIHQTVSNKGNMKTSYNRRSTGAGWERVYQCMKLSLP